MFAEMARPPSDCDICYEPFTEANPHLGPILGDHPTRCRHLACESCWDAIAAQPPPWHCPMCRENVSAWLADATDWTQPADSVDMYDMRLFTQFTLDVLEARGLAPELQELGRQILRPLPR